jgi:mannosyltransferase
VTAVLTPVAAPPPIPWVRRLDRAMPLLSGLASGLLMLVVALIGATRAVLSWDEVTSADVAGRSASQIWAVLRNVDAVFGPYYFLLHYWTGAVGDSVLDLRLPSILAMAGAAGVAAELARRLYSPLTGFVTGLIFVLLPNTTRYAAEARPYAFASFFSLLALLLLYRALERPSAARWTGYGLAVVAVGLSHIVALTTLGAHLVLLGRHRQAWRPWTLTAAIALLLLAPVAWMGRGQQHEQLSWIPPLTWPTLRAAPGEITGYAPAGWLLIGLALVAVSRIGLPLVAMVLIPPGVIAVVSVLSAPLWVPRYLLVVLGPASILAAAGTVGDPGVRRKEVGLRVVAVLVVLAFAVVPGQRLVRGATYKNGSDYRSVAAVIEAGQRPGDSIVLLRRNRAMRAGIDYYLRHDAGRPTDVLVRYPASAVASLIAQEYPNAAARLTGVSRVWLLVYGNHSDPTTGRPDLRSLLRSGYRRAAIWHLHRATLALFSRRP